MKTPAEIFKEMSVGEQTASRWIKIIESAQKEAWNEAIEAAVKNVTLYSQGGVDFSHLLNKQSILKLSK